MVDEEGVSRADRSIRLQTHSVGVGDRVAFVRTQFVTVFLPHSPARPRWAGLTYFLLTLAPVQLQAPTFPAFQFALTSAPLEGP